MDKEKDTVTVALDLFSPQAQAIVFDVYRTGGMKEVKKSFPDLSESALKAAIKKGGKKWKGR